MVKLYLLCVQASTGNQDGQAKVLKMRTATDVIERIKQVLGISSDTELSKYFSIPKTTISGWKARDSVPYELCVQVSDLMGASLDWLLTGVGAIQRDRVSEARAVYPAVTPKEQAVLDLYRGLDEGGQREIEMVAEEKKRLRVLEQQMKELRDALAERQRSA